MFPPRCWGVNEAAVLQDPSGRVVDYFKPLRAELHSAIPPGHNHGDIIHRDQVQQLRQIAPGSSLPVIIIVRILDGRVSIRGVPICEYVVRGSSNLSNDKR